MELSIPLEKKLNKHDEYKRRRMELVDEVSEVNIGSSVSPKMVRIGKNTSPKQGKVIEKLIRECKDVFTWTYDDMKTYDPSIIEHTIPPKERGKPYRKKICNINRKLAPLVKKEIEKMLDVGIIRPIRHTTWVFNHVIVRKKSKETRICIDFRKLNQVSLKDNYPLPNMENLLQSVTRVELLSTLEVFSWYNKVQIKKEDR